MNEEESDIEERFSSGFFKKGTKDKLTYKNIIADSINWCRKTMGTPKYKGAVNGLEKIIDFDIQGYELHTRILEIKTEIKEELNKYERREEKRMGRKIRKNAEKAKLRLRKDQIRWELYFSALIQLLAEHDLLFDTERQIPFKKLGRITRNDKKG